MRLSRPLFTQHGLNNLEPWDLVSVQGLKDGLEEFNVTGNSEQNLSGTFSSKFGLLLPQSFGSEIPSVIINFHY